MATRQMTYAELGAAWGVSPEAARKRTERFPRTIGNDGRTRISVDLDEIEPRPPQPKAGRRPAGLHPETELLKQHVATLQAEVERLTSLAGSHRSDFERERDRAERAISDLSALAGRLADAERERACQLANAVQARSETEQARSETEAARMAENLIRAQAEAVRAELTDWKARPWWRRAFG